MNAPTSKLRVLVVDDDPDVRTSTRALLRSIGHDARGASGQAALKLAAQWRPDVALIDLHMTNRDGCELARWLRKLDGMGGALLVALTADADRGDIARARAADFDAFLLKPVGLSPLEALLRENAPDGGS
jgi:CheY-like chemotaxis protein